MVSFIFYDTVEYDGQVEWDTYSAKRDGSPTSHSTVGHVGLKHMTDQWMVTHILHGT